MAGAPLCLASLKAAYNSLDSSCWWVLGHCWYKCLIHIVLTFAMWTCTFPEHWLILRELVLLFLGFPCPIFIQCMVMLGISILSFSVCSDSNTSLASCGFESPSAISMIAALHFLNSLLWFHGFFGLLLGLSLRQLYLQTLGLLAGVLQCHVYWPCSLSWLTSRGCSCVVFPNFCAWHPGPSSPPSFSVSLKIGPLQLSPSVIVFVLEHHLSSGILLWWAAVVSWASFFFIEMAMGTQERAAQFTCPWVCRHWQALIVTVDLLIGSCQQKEIKSRRV